MNLTVLFFSWQKLKNGVRNRPPDTRWLKQMCAQISMSLYSQHHFHKLFAQCRWTWCIDVIFRCSCIFRSSSTLTRHHWECYTYAVPYRKHSSAINIRALPLPHEFGKIYYIFVCIKLPTFEIGLQRIGFQLPAPGRYFFIYNHAKSIDQLTLARILIKFCTLRSCFWETLFYLLSMRNTVNAIYTVCWKKQSRNLITSINAVLHVQLNDCQSNENFIARSFFLKFFFFFPTW